MLTLIILGTPASGKATQAALLLKKYKLVNLDMGKELRKLQKNDSAAKTVLDRTIDKGKTAPTNIVRVIFRDVISKTPKNRGILFNGTPKMLGEARLVHKLLNQAGRDRNEVLFLYLNIPDREIIKRIIGRSKTQNRADDNLQALKKRLKYTKTAFQEVVRFFSSKYESANISGLGSVKQVHSRIIKAINEFANKKQRRNS